MLSRKGISVGTAGTFRIMIYIGMSSYVYIHVYALKFYEITVYCGRGGGGRGC